MDLNDVRSLVTVAGLLLFVALVAWTWSARRRTACDSAAALPFQGEEEIADGPPLGDSAPSGGRRQGRLGGHIFGDRHE